MAVLSTELKNASAAARAGRYAEAIALYRRVLARSPEHAEATHFLGVCLVQSGHRDEGLALLERSVALAPRNTLYRQNFGLLLAEADDLPAAEAQFVHMLNLEKHHPTAHNYLGMVRQRLGRFDEASAAYREALRLAPADAAAANNLGYCLLERGDVEGALEWLRRSIAADARNAMAHSNLGNALRTQGDPEGAARSYRRALALAPRLANAHYNLALTLRDLGEPSSLAAAREAVGCAPEHRPAWQLFAELLAPRRFAAWDAALAADCERLLSETDVEVQHCAEALLSLVRAAPRGRLFLLLLEHALVADGAFEREMPALRREQLVAPQSLELCCALAHQCFLNEYLWPEQADESAVIERLKTEATTPLQLATLAMYRPIRSLAKPSGGGEAFERLWRRLVEEPAQEASMEIDAITPIADEVSAKVRAQYEANPYPRWHRAPAAGAFPLPRMLRALFPHFDPARLAAPAAPRVLIAGCGTGRHAAITAQLQPHGRILAVDLSRASLAYAMRRCGELGLRNIRFAQADILQLGALEERFDLIECSGVLHHMRDPLAGWRVLLSLLDPGGFMKLGLYSGLARRHIGAARELVHGLDVRAARARIFALAADDPARTVTTLRDFYSASGARDLILHVQEHRFSIPQLASAVAELGVEFVGFELPGRRMALALEQWDAYETANPDTFASMYQFWIRKPDGGTA
jgi:Flp pilus assembly protein TadD/SAM-dependent methyltransferase